MNEVLKLLVDSLMNDVRFSGVIQTRFSALFAKEETPTPYCVYGIPEAVKTQTKDGKLYTLSVAIYFAPDQFTELCAFVDQVLEIIAQSSFIFKELLIGYDNVYNEINATIMLQITQY